MSVSKSPVPAPPIAELEHHPDQPLLLYAQLRRVEQLETRTGQPYAALELADESGTIAARIWSDQSAAMQAAAELAAGDLVKVLATTDLYQQRLQLAVTRLRRADPETDALDLGAIVGRGSEAIAGRHCSTLVFDIETVPAHNTRKVPSMIAQAVSKAAERGDGDEGKVMSLSPLLGKVVSLAFADAETWSPQGPDDVSQVTVLAVPPEGWQAEGHPPWLVPVDEPTLLRCFWSLAASAPLVVTYNGRGFDVPFLVARSLVHGIAARVDLLSNRFSLRPHLDLYQLLSGGRALGPMSLDVVCWALGVTSPKDVMDGSMVAPAYEKGEIERIARYNAGDVAATIEVFLRAREHILKHRADF
ncbi:MAG: ribonuclease H-like domain-containing protein [Myxococcales bacterium]|nr:ribonuclease H-like domain-containing protein [Myxococcales bacterium]